MLYLFVFWQELTQVGRDRQEIVRQRRTPRYSAQETKSRDSRNKQFSILLHRKNDERDVGTYFIVFGFLMLTWRIQVPGRAVYIDNLLYSYRCEFGFRLLGVILQDRKNKWFRYLLVWNRSFIYETKSCVLEIVPSASHVKRRFSY